MIEKQNNFLFKNYTKLILFFFLILAFIFLYSQKIDLTTSDLGRYITNGKVFFTQKIIPQTNYYSYTNPNYQFVNHHWLFGVLIFPIFSVIGFEGISILFLLLQFSILLLAYSMTNKKTNFLLLYFFLFLTICVNSSRIEVRPEVISLFFSVTYFFLLNDFIHSSKFPKILIIPIVQLVWINMHIYFFMGPLIIGLFLFQEILNQLYLNKKDYSKICKLLIILFITLSVLIINPRGLYGILYPLIIFQNYNFQVFENTSPFAIKPFLSYIPNLFYLILLIVSYLILIITGLKNRKFLFLNSANFIIFILTTLFSLQAIRNFSFFGTFSFIFFSQYLSNLKLNSYLNDLNYKKNFFRIFLFFTVCFTIIFFFTSSYWKIKVKNFGIGLRSENLGAIEFIKNNKIKGPIFNNYDTGSYLIYGLFPEQRVFVDNRPEAYPALFFQSVYHPSFSDEETWKKIDDYYNFNIIMVNKNNLDSKINTFISKRLDNDWVLIFNSKNVLLLTKNNVVNKDIIEKFKIRDKILNPVYK